MSAFQSGAAPAGVGIVPLGARASNRRRPGAAAKPWRNRCVLLRAYVRPSIHGLSGPCWLSACGALRGSSRGASCRTGEGRGRSVWSYCKGAIGAVTPGDRAPSKGAGPGCSAGLGGGNPRRDMPGPETAAADYAPAAHTSPPVGAGMRGEKKRHSEHTQPAAAPDRRPLAGSRHPASHTRCAHHRPPAGGESDERRCAFNEGRRLRHMRPQTSARNVARLFTAALLRQPYTCLAMELRAPPPARGGVRTSGDARFARGNVAAPATANFRAKRHPLVLCCRAAAAFIHNIRSGNPASARFFQQTS